MVSEIINDVLEQVLQYIQQGNELPTEIFDETRFKIKIAKNISDSVKKEYFSMLNFYHGTDERIVNMSSSERMSMQLAARKVVDILFDEYNKVLNFFVDGFVKADPLVDGVKTMVKDKQIQANFMQALQRVGFEKSGNNKYQYNKDVIYLTGNKDTAENYARSSYCFGEIGLNAYRLIQAIDNFNIANKPEVININNEIEILRQFALSEKRPVVYVLNGLNPDYFKDEARRSNYREISPSVYNLYNWIYEKEINLKQYPRVEVMV